MSTDSEPLARQVADVEAQLVRRVRDIAWTVGKWLGKELPRILVAGTSGGAAVVWAAVGLHEAAFLIGALLLLGAFVALAGYTLGLRKQFVDERTMRRQAFAAGKRLQQDVLKRDLALDLATLILVKDPKDRGTAHRLSAPGSTEFAAAVRYLRARVTAAVSSQRPQPPRAVSRGHVPVAPVAPDVTGVRWRRDLRMSELAKLEAEIQALWAPDVLELTVAAADAGRSYKNRRAAAHLADRVARDRQRRGRKPTERGSELGLQVSFHPNGSRVVRRVAPDATPEQIAGGEQPPVPDSDR